MLTPTKRVSCQHASKWPREERLYTPSQMPPPVQIHENNQAFAWVQKTLAGKPLPEGWDLNPPLPSGTVAGAIFDDWGVKANGQVPVLGRWLEEHITESLTNGRPISWQWDVTITM
eukprot:6531681-Heterocapsa_arctica.AAC.1